MDPHVPEPHPTNSLREHLRFGFLMAVSFSAFATLVILVEGALKLAGISHVQMPPVTELIAFLLAVYASYFLAGLSGGYAVWRLRGLRSRFVGWPLTGFVVAFLIYGSIGLLAAIAFTVTGFNLLDSPTPTAAWRNLPRDAIGLGLVVGIPAGIWFWWKRPWG